MKKAIFTSVLFMVIISLTAFNWSTSENLYDHLLDEESKAEKLFTTESNTALITNLGQFLATKLDNIDRVDVHWGAEKAYYFCAYGQKDGVATVQQVLVSEEMACTQQFPSLAQMGIAAGSTFVHCYWKEIRIGPFTLKVCAKINEGAICGYSPSGDLCVRVDEHEIGQQQ